MLDSKCLEETLPFRHPVHAIGVQDQHVDASIVSLGTACEVGVLSVGLRCWEGVNVVPIVFDSHFVAVFPNPMISLVLVVSKGGGWCVFAQSGCDCETAWSGTDNKDVVDVHIS